MQIKTFVFDIFCILYGSISSFKHLLRFDFEFLIFKNLQMSSIHLWVWDLFFIAYPSYASLLQPSLEFRLAPEKKCLLHVPLDDTIQMQTVIGDFSKQKFYTEKL